MPSSSFSAKRLSASTILITEDDIYREHPQIFVKVHFAAPVIIIGDTGCDKASENNKHGMRKTVDPNMKSRSSRPRWRLPSRYDSPLLNPHPH
jgi:hypothetical protein